VYIIYNVRARGKGFVIASSFSLAEKMTGLHPAVRPSVFLSRKKYFQIFFKNFLQMSKNSIFAKKNP